MGVGSHITWMFVFRHPCKYNTLNRECLQCDRWAFRLGSCIVDECLCNIAGIVATRPLHKAALTSNTCKTQNTEGKESPWSWLHDSSIIIKPFLHSLEVQFPLGWKQLWGWGYCDTISVFGPISLIAVRWMCPGHKRLTGKFQTLWLMSLECIQQFCQCSDRKKNPQFNLTLKKKRKILSLTWHLSCFCTVLVLPHILSHHQEQCQRR